MGYENEAMNESELAWVPDLRIDPSISGLDEQTSWNDLERMGVSHLSAKKFKFQYANFLFFSLLFLFSFS